MAISLDRADHSGDDVRNKLIAPKNSRFAIVLSRIIQARIAAHLIAIATAAYPSPALDQTQITTSIAADLVNIRLTITADAQVRLQRFGDTYHRRLDQPGSGQASF